MPKSGLITTFCLQTLIQLVARGGEISRALNNTGTLRNQRSVRWEKPLEGWVKLNTDGGVSQSTGIASAGGLARDSAGAWLRGLWALIYGLGMVWELGGRRVCCEVDCREVVEAVNQNKDDGGLLGQTVRGVCERLGWFEEVEIKHVYREANMTADCLAALGMKKQRGIHMLETPPADVLQRLNHDLHGVSQPRVIVI